MADNNSQLKNQERRDSQRNDFENYKNNYCMKKDWVFPYAEITKGSDILLYGAGDVGQAYYEQITNSQFCKIVQWVDINYQIYQEYGLSVCSPEEVGKKHIDYVVIAVSDSNLARTINNILIKIGIPQDIIIWNSDERKTIRESWVDNRLKNAAESILKSYIEKKGDNYINEKTKNLIRRALADKDKLILPRIVLEITTACTRKCSYCNNLMPLYDHPNHVLYEDVIRDLRVLVQEADWIITVELIGGEPFLYPQLADVLEYLINEDSIVSVEITTNGNVLPNMEVIDKLKNPKVIVLLSDYMDDPRIDIFKQKMSDNGIYLEINDALSWIDTGGTYNRKWCTRERQRIYRECYASKFCKTVFKGRLYSCARAVGLYDLGICNRDDGYLDLMDPSNRKNRIRKFFLDKDSIACDYCNGMDEWRQVTAGL